MLRRKVKALGRFKDDGKSNLKMVPKGKGFKKSNTNLRKVTRHCNFFLS